MKPFPECCSPCFIVICHSEMFIIALLRCSNQPLSLCTPVGLQRVHEPRRQPAARTESVPADRSERDRSDGEHCTQEVLDHRDAAEAKYVRGDYDPPISLPRCKVCINRPAIIISPHVLSKTDTKFLIKAIEKMSKKKLAQKQFH